MTRLASLRLRIATLSVLAGAFLFAASAAQAIYVDLSGLGAGSTDMTIEGYSLTVMSKDFDVMMGAPLSINHLSITFNEGPVALNSVDIHFASTNIPILADVMGRVSVISATAVGLTTVDLGGLEGNHTSFTSFGSSSNVVGIEFDLSSASGVGTFSSAVPEPNAALLFAAALGIITTRRRLR